METLVIASVESERSTLVTAMISMKNKLQDGTMLSTPDKQMVSAMSGLTDFDASKSTV